MKIQKLTLAGAVVALAASMAVPAHAVPVAGTARLCIDDDATNSSGLAAYCVVDNSADDSLPAIDGKILLVKAPYGANWIINVDTGTTNPAPEADYPELDITFDNTSLAAGTIFITMSQVGFDLATAVSTIFSVGGTLDPGGSWIGRIYIDSANQLGAMTTLLATLGPLSNVNNFFGGSAFAEIPADGLFSMTMQIELTHTAGGQSTGDANWTPVPEPASLALLGLGLLGIGAVRRRKVL